MEQFSSKPKLLVVEDDEALRTQMKWALVQDYEVLMAEDRAGALDLLRDERPPVVTLDLGLPPHPEGAEEGFLTLADMLHINPLVKVISLQARGKQTMQKRD